MEHPSEEARLRAALDCLGIAVPPQLAQASGEDAGLRVASLWALLYRAAGSGLSDATSGTDNDYGYLVSAYEWPVPEDQAARAVAELRFAHDRIQSVADTVPPWSAAVGTGDDGEDEVDGWATAAAHAADAAAWLLGPLAHVPEAGAASPGVALAMAVHNLDQAVTYVGRLTESLGLSRCTVCSRMHSGYQGSVCGSCTRSG